MRQTSRGRWLVVGVAAMAMFAFSLEGADHTSPEGFESAPACSPDGRWILRKDKEENTFSLWRRDDGTKHLTFRGHEDLIWDLAFCPDSMRIISASADHTARVWDVETGEQLAILAGHGAGVLTAKFGPRGRYILTGGRDANLRLWDASSYEQVIRLSGHESYVIDAAISPDGDTIATASGDHTVRLWGTKPLKDQHQRRLARRAVVDAVSRKVETLFDALGDPDAVVTALQEDATLDDEGASDVGYQGNVRRSQRS